MVSVSQPSGNSFSIWQPCPNARPAMIEPSTTPTKNRASGGSSLSLLGDLPRPALPATLTLV